MEAASTKTGSTIISGNYSQEENLKNEDFPQKQPGTIIKMYLVGGLLSTPTIRKRMGNKMAEGMLAPYRKVLKRTERKRKQ